MQCSRARNPLHATLKQSASDVVQFWKMASVVAPVNPGKQSFMQCGSPDERFVLEADRREGAIISNKSHSLFSLFFFS
jgi:hypothetical protein